MSYLSRRLVAVPPTLLLVSIGIFVLLRVLPGDPVAYVLGTAAGAGGGVTVSKQSEAALRAKFGLDGSLFSQYGHWISSLLRLNAGSSYVSGRSVLSEIAEAVPVSLELAILGTLVALIIGIPAGVFASARKDGLLARVLRTGTFTFIGLPVFLLGTLLLLVLFFSADWSPPLGYASFAENPLLNLEQLIWPALVLGAYHGAIIARMTATQVESNLLEDFVRTARSKGIQERAVLARHVLRNSLLPILSLSSIQFTAMIGNVVIVERMFGIPGVGQLLVTSIIARDYPVVQGIIVFIALFVLVVNLGTDLIYPLVDPRVRLTRARRRSLGVTPEKVLNS